MDQDVSRISDNDPGAPLPGQGRFPFRPALLALGFLLAIAVLFALALHRVFIANVNWDEFFYLSQVHLYLNGELAQPLQTLHVHLFRWLPLVSGDEVHQIFAARGFLWLLSIATCLCIYDVARNFCTREAALLAVLFYAGFSYVVDHGHSVRADPLSAFLFVAAVQLLLTAKRSRLYMAVSGALMAAAIMVTIKSSLYFSSLGVIFLAFFLFEADRRAVLRDALIFTAGFAGALLLLYQVHSYALAAEELADPGAYLARTGGKTLLSTPLLPRLNFLLNALAHNGPIWVFVLLGLSMAGQGLVKGPDRKRALLLAALAVPLLSLLFYRNAFPYFYVFLMPAVVILGGVFADVLIERGRRTGSRTAAAVLAGTVALILGSAVWDYLQRLPDQTLAQRELVATVHRMFPEPVPYIDRNAMIASFPAAGFFMSTWGMETYWAGNRPIMEERLRQKRPRFLIANSCALDLDGRQTADGVPCQTPLLAEDFETLSANFVHHWGPIYVAGKRFELHGPAAPVAFEILVPGTYSLEAEASVSIDGMRYRPGDRVVLGVGEHRIVADDAATGAILRFGAGLYRPDHAPAAQPIYVPL